jgi:hypothetical protein
MRASSYILVGAVLIMICACNGVKEEALEKRVEELRDSLGVYRDSLRSVQKYWTFNSLIPVVKMSDIDPRVGDTCYIEVFLAAANMGENGYRSAQAGMSLRTPMYSRHGYSEMNSHRGWHFPFVPERVGKDSVTGTIQVLTAGMQDTVELTFTNHFTVEER